MVGTIQVPSMGGRGGRVIKTLGVIFIALLAVLFLFFQVIDSNDADSTIVLQTITGDLRVISEPGPYMRFFGTPYKYKKVVSVNFTGEKGATAESVLDRIKVRFLDTSVGMAKGVARFRMPINPKDMISIHREFGSQAGLMSNLLERAVIESTKASARTMSVEQHYSGGAGQMSLDFDDQIRNGVFVVEQVTEYVKPEPSSEPGAMGETLQRRQRVLVVKKKDTEGKYVRTKSGLQEYKISVISASIEEVDYEERVDARLAAQKQAAADEALARQNLKKAQQEAKTAKALGEKAIAEAKAREEKSKLEAEIRAQKEASVATINAKREVEVARQQKIQAEIEAEKETSVAVIDAKREVEVARQSAAKQTEILEQQKTQAEGLQVLADARRQAAEYAMDPQLVFEQKLKAWQNVEMTKYKYMSQSRLVPVVQMGQNGQQPPHNAMTMLELLGVRAAMDLGMQFENIGSSGDGGDAAGRYGDTAGDHAGDARSQ